VAEKVKEEYVLSRYVKTNKERTIVIERILVRNLRAVMGRLVDGVIGDRLAKAGPVAKTEKLPVTYSSCVVTTRTYVCPNSRLTWRRNCS
jgi:hypothetical protein